MPDSKSYPIATVNLVLPVKSKIITMSQKGFSNSSPLSAEECADSFGNLVGGGWAEVTDILQQMQRP